LLDVSGSMVADGKIQALNAAIQEAIPHIQSAARNNPHVQVHIRSLTFASSVRWVTDEPQPVETFRWTDVAAEPRGFTELGLALSEMASAVADLSALDRGMTPAMVLVSDGQPTDLKAPSFRKGLEELMAEQWGAKAVRLAIGIGRDADRGVLKRFIGHPEIDPVQANNPQQLVDMIRWASTVAVGAASVPVKAVPQLERPPVEQSQDGPLIWDLDSE
jgi:uncharacterized protein YegL